MTLTLNVRSLTISQFSSASTSGDRFGHVTDSGLLPAASVIFGGDLPGDLGLLTECECDAPRSKTSRLRNGIRAVAAPEASSAERSSEPCRLPGI